MTVRANAALLGWRGQNHRMWVVDRRRPTLPEAKEWTKRFGGKSCVANPGIVFRTSQFGNAYCNNYWA
jgi:hypothetical protein